MSMSHFYGVVSGQAKSTATRRGSQKTGLTTQAASWAGAVRVEMYHEEETGRDCAMVRLVQWRGEGVEAILYRGPVDAAPAQVASELEKRAEQSRDDGKPRRREDLRGALEGCVSEMEATARLIEDAGEYREALDAARAALEGGE